MKTYNLAILGYGQVAKAFVELWHDYQKTLQSAQGFDLRIVLVARSTGAIYEPTGAVDAQMNDDSAFMQQNKTFLFCQFH